jgi:hypothetical protein
MIDGLSINESPLFDSENPFENRDPRLTQSIVTPGSVFNGTQVVENQGILNVTGYAIKKYTYFKDREASPPPPNQQGAINAIIFRYAEILLTLAEAENEINGPTPIAYDAINQVRSRSSVQMPGLTQGLSQDEFREMIRLERRIELVGEGLYIHDIKRWRTAETMMNETVTDRQGNILEVRVFDPARDYLWPIPTREILLNPNLDQNPGF